MTAPEPYALAYDVTRNRWSIYRRGTDDVVADRIKTRDAAVKRLDALTEAWIKAQVR